MMTSVPKATDRWHTTYEGEFEIANEGQGSVWTVKGRHDLVLKVYHGTPDSEIIAKLEALAKLNLSSASPGVQFATPIETVAMADGRIGYTMRKASGMQLINLLSPALHKRFGPEAAHLPFVLQVACNLIECGRTVHAAGCVIGDVNPKNFLVDRSGAVTLLDCDSMQVPNSTRPGNPYRCTVGMPEYQPPELDAWDVVRQPGHDIFGLGVLLFQLLYGGNHPFLSAVVPGRSRPLEKREAIQRGAYIFNQKLAPHQKSIVARKRYSVEIDHLWDQCFQIGHMNPAMRPAAVDWARVFDSLRIEALAVEHIRAARLRGDMTGMFREYRNLRSSFLLTKDEHAQLSKLVPELGDIPRLLGRAIADGDAAMIEMLLEIVDMSPGIVVDHSRAQKALQTLYAEQAILFRLALGSGIDEWGSYAAAQVSDKAYQYLADHERAHLLSFRRST